MAGVNVEIGTAYAYLVLEDKGFFDGLNKASSAMEEFEDKSNKAGQTLTNVIKFGDKMASVGDSLTRNVTTPLVRGAQSALDAYKDFEVAVTGIRKTVDDAEVALAFGLDPNKPEDAAKAYKLLSDQIEQMAIKTGVSAEELAGVGEMAGQLGIEVGKDGKTILDFTETMAKLGVTTNLSASDAALALAKFINVSDATQDDAQKLGSVIVDLGNNFATQESDIVFMSQRLASAGTIAGLTSREILALATAVSSAGIKTEAGASSMSTNLMRVAKIVELAGTEADETGENFQKLGQIAEIAGMSGDEFARLWKTQPVAALQAFYTGLGRVNDEGGSMALILDDLGMKSIRESNLVRALALSSENLADAVNVANTAWVDNNALQIEFDKYASTTQQRLNMLHEEWQAVKRDLGEILLPILEKLMQIVKEFIKWWNSLSDSTKNFIVQVLALVAALGPVLSIGGRIISGVARLISGIGSLVQALPKVVSIIEGIASIGNKVAGVGLSVLSAIKFVQNFIDIWNNGVTVVKAALLILQGALTGLGLVIAGLASPWAIVIGAAVGAIAAVVAAIHQHSDEIKAWWNNTVLPWLKSIPDKIKELFQHILDFFEKIGEGVKNFIQNAIDKVKELVEKIGQFFDTMWQKVSSVISSIASAVGSFISNVFSSVSSFLSNLWSNISGFFSNLFSSIGQFFSNVISNATQFFSNIFSGLKGFITNVISNITNFFQNAFEKVKKFISDVISGVTQFFSNVIGKVGEFVSNIITKVVTFFSQLISEFASWVSKMATKIAEAIKDWISKITQGGRDFVEGFIKGLTEKIKKAVDAVKSFGGKILDGLKSVLGIHSPSREAEDIAQLTAEGYIKGTDESITKVNATIDKFGKSVLKYLDITPQATEVGKKISTAYNNELTKMGEQSVKISNTTSTNLNGEYDKMFVQMNKSVVNFGETTNSTMTKLFSNLTTVINSAMKTINSGFNSQLMNMNASLESFVSRARRSFMELNSMQNSYNYVDGSHASGLDYVPYNGYIAELHKGERVLTKEENEVYNNGGGASSGDTYNFYNTKDDPYEYARQIKRVKKELAF